MLRINGSDMEDHERERKAIQLALLEALKECQARFGSGQELATEQDARVVVLVATLERALNHGLLQQQSSGSLSSISSSINTPLMDMVRGLLNTESREAVKLFGFISSFLTKHELDRFHSLKNVSSDCGRARAWIRCSLNEHSLAKYCEKMFCSRDRCKLEDYYERWAFVRDKECCAVLETTAQGMRSILFALNVDNVKLDPEDPVAPLLNGTVMQNGFEAPGPVVAPGASEGQIVKASNRKKHSLKQVNDRVHEKVTGTAQGIAVVRSSPCSIVQSPSRDSPSADEDDSYLQTLGKSPSIAGALQPVSDSLGLSYGELIPVKGDDLIVEDAQSNASGRSDKACAISLRNAMLSEGELRDALETTVERRKQLERDIEILKENLVAEQERSKRAEEKLSRVDARLAQTQKELDQVKSQLRKYVHAVQMLKDSKKDGIGESVSEDPHASMLRSYDKTADLINTASTSMGYAVDDPTNYEVKLVQVAEMHAELMEFNERLQKQLAVKETSLRRLREELTDLRGPLAENEQDSSSETHSMTSDYDTTSQFRPSINIWIPSAFLAGQGSDAFHVYQVYVRIGEEEWNVYRRYSQFYSLHKTLSKGQSVFASFDFPPKKSLGKKDAKLVQERRKRLQRYLRCVINWLLQGNSRLSQNADKATLIEVMPFFGDRDQAHVRRRRSPFRRPLIGNPHYVGL